MAPPARPAAVCRRAWPEDWHHRRPDRIPQPHRVAGPKGAIAPHATAVWRVHRPCLPRRASQPVRLALVKGQWDAADSVPVRVHEPLSVLDALDDTAARCTAGAWTPACATSPPGPQRGRAAELRRNRRATARAVRGHARAAQAPSAAHGLRTYGGRADPARGGVARMQLWPAPAHAQHDSYLVFEITAPQEGRKRKP